MPLLGTPIIVVGYYVGFNNGVGGTYGFREIGGTYTNDPPPLKWSDLRYVFDIQEDCNGKEAIQA